MDSFADMRLPETYWPIYKGSLQLTGQSNIDTSKTGPGIKWRFQVKEVKDDDEGGIESSPAIAKDGTIYIGSWSNEFVAVNSDGTEKWRYKGEEKSRFTSSPAIGPDKTVYMAGLVDLRVGGGTFSADTSHGVITLYAFSPEGEKKWQFNAGGKYEGTHPGVIVDDSGTVYIGGGNIVGPNDKVGPNREGGGYFWALNPDGTVKWKVFVGSGIYSVPAIGKDGIIYLTTTGNNVGYLIALTQEGKEIWRYQAAHAIAGSPTIASDGTIYFGANDKIFYAVDSNGKEKWRYAGINQIIESAPSIGPDGTIYTGTLWPEPEDPYLYALNPDGTLKWKFKTELGVGATPVFGKDGTIFFACTSLYALYPDGKLKWELSTPGVGFPPALGSDGTIYFGGGDGYLYAVGADEEQKGDIAAQTSGDENTRSSQGRSLWPPVLLTAVLLTGFSTLLILRRKKKYNESAGKAV